MVRGDADCVATLATQLGYPSTAEQIRQRFKNVAGNREHSVMVAEDAGAVAGWLHIFVCRVMESDPYAEIGGLVVDERRRGAGIGRLLLQQAEAWARTKGCASIRLRSNIIRTEAHEFYLKRGYTITKTQHAFMKTL